MSLPNCISFDFEECARKKGFKRIAGVDEAGRGPLAGPVVAASCILPEGVAFDGLNDSKKLRASQREELFTQLTTHPDTSWGVGVVDAGTIDEINILQATLHAMLLATQQLNDEPDFLLIDGIHAPNTKTPSQTIVKGDSLSYSIAAASVIAKVTRDRMMREYHELYPEYGFDRHKGYGTHLHLTAINEKGPCPIHRMSFEPIKSIS